MGLLAWSLVVGVSPCEGQEPFGILSIETVVEDDADPRYPTRPEIAYSHAEATVEEERTGRRWYVQCPKGWCEAAVPPGVYRVTVHFAGGGDTVVLGVPVAANRPSVLRVQRSAEGKAEVAPRIAATAGGVVPPTFVAIGEPTEVRWPLTDACHATADVAGERYEEKRPLRSTPSISEVWADLRDWWGQIAGSAVRPDGQLLDGVPVHLEYLGQAEGVPRSVAPWSRETTKSGCWGWGGLWPGRYRIVIDHPPFAHVTEFDVLPGKTVRVGQTVLQVTAPARRTVPTLRINSSTWGRITDTTGLVRAVRRASLPHRNVDVSGVAAWWYLPGTWQTLFPVDNAQITWEDELTGRRTHASTDPTGQYHIQLPLGVYRVIVERAPFLTLRARAIVTPEGHAILDGARTTNDASGLWIPAATYSSGLMPRVHFDLALPVRERTDAHANAVTVRPERAAPPGFVSPLGARWTSDETRVSLWTSSLPDAPLPNGRTLQSVHQFVPGITYTESTGSQAQFTSAGQRRFANELTIDGISGDLGVNVSEPGVTVAGSGGLPARTTSGSTQTLIPFGAIAEMETLTTGVAPEHARTPGAQTIIETRAGGRRFEGELFANVRPSALGATDWFDNANGRRRQRQSSASGISLGGPGPGMTWWTTWEEQAFDRSVEMTFPVPSATLREKASPPVRALLNAFSRPNGDDLGSGRAELSTTVPVTSRLSVLSTRIDATLSSRHRVFARVSHGRSAGTSLTDFAQLPVPTHDNHEQTGTTSVTLGVTSVGNSAMHDARFNVTQHRGELFSRPARFGGAQPLPLDMLVPAEIDSAPWVRINLADGTTLINGLVSRKAQRQLQLVDTWRVQRGRHAWSFGTDLRWVVASAEVPNRYTFWFDDFGTAPSGRLQGAAIDFAGRARARINSWSAFLQDDVRVSPRLSVQYGLRYSVRPAPRPADLPPQLFEIEHLPDLQPRSDAPLWNTSWRDLAPRIAATYRFGSIDGPGTTVHGSWGLTFDENTSPGAIAVGRGFPSFSRGIVHAPAFPVVASDLAVSRPGTFHESALGEAYAFPTNLRSPRVSQWHIGLDRPLNGQQRVAVAYVGAIGRQLPYWFAYDVGSDPGFHTVHAWSNDATSDYQALFAEYTRRVARGFQARATYTWSHAIDTDSGEAVSPHRPPSDNPPATNRASADFDRRHVLHLTASYLIPTVPASRWLRRLFSNWTLDLFGTLQSGAPVSVEIKFDPENLPYATRPDVVSGVPIWLDDATSPGGRHINPDAFILPLEARQGNLGRNALRASPLRQVDLRLTRSIRLTGTSVVQLQIEALNILNLVNFGPPRSDPSLSTFGAPSESYAHALGSGTLNRGGLTPLMQVGGPRALQVGVQLRW